MNKRMFCYRCKTALTVGGVECRKCRRKRLVLVGRIQKAQRLEKDFIQINVPKPKRKRHLGKRRIYESKEN